MAIRDVTLSEIDRLRADADTADVAFEMDEDTFRRSGRTSVLWPTFAGQPQGADDLLQSLLRFLRRTR